MGWMNGWCVGLINGCVLSMDGWMGGGWGRVNGWVVWMDGWVGGWWVVWMDGWMGGGWEG